MPTRLLLVDDQVLFIESLKSVFQSRADDMEVVGVAHDGAEAVKLAEKLRPDIILMDVRMPRMDGVEATRVIHERFPESKIVMLTTYDDDCYVRHAIEYGAIGYLLKDMQPEDLFRAVRTVEKGAFLVTSSVMPRLIWSESGKFVATGEGDTKLPQWYYFLSRKERHILRLVAEGYTNQEIAERVFLATQTVKNYLSGIYEKIGVHDRPEATAKAQPLLHYL
jgi:DNA-binding NarL/FixJ family response regulator